jgi:hypothetical protein
LLCDERSLTFLTKHIIPSNNNNRTTTFTSRTTMDPDFPAWEHHLARSKPKPMMVNNRFLSQMPKELIKIKETFWDNWDIIRPVDKNLVFEFPMRLQDHRNFWKQEVAEGFVDSDGQGWIKIVFNDLEDQEWYPYEVVKEVVPEQLVYKILFEGWIYQHKYWWKVIELWKCLEVPEVIDLTVDVMPGCKVEQLEVVVLKQE